MQVWLENFIEAARASNKLLRDSGAETVAEARERLIRHLLDAYQEWGNGTVSVAEAAQLTGACEETVRRAVREGRLTDLRDNPRGHIRVKRSELGLLNGRTQRRHRERNGTYNPVADAQDIARLRRN